MARDLPSPRTLPTHTSPGISEACTQSAPRYQNSPAGETRPGAQGRGLDVVALWRDRLNAKSRHAAGSFEVGANLSER